MSLTWKTLKHLAGQHGAQCVGLLLAVTMALGVAKTTQAATITVCGSGGATYTTIKAAEVAATSGDTITICAGTYRENVQSFKALTFSGAGAGVTIWDGRGLDRAIVSTGDLTLAEMTVQNGVVSDINGGGIRSNGNLTLTNVTVYSNTATGFATFGGGAWASGMVFVSGSTFEKNSTGAGGGGLYGSGAAVVTATQFLSNTAGTSFGGGMYTNGPTTVSGGLVSNNVSSSAGGGLAVFGTLTMSGTQFISNTSTSGPGGGLHVTQRADISNARFERNTSATYGGGLNAVSTLVLTDTQFFTNTSNGTGTTIGGGGLYANGLTTIAGGLFSGNTSKSLGGGALGVTSVTMSGTQFISNTASGNGGGLHSSGGVTMNTVGFTDNTATNYGGAIHAKGTVWMTGTQIIGNIAQHYGGGLSADQAANVRLVNVLLARNSAGWTGNEIYWNSTGIGTVMLSTIVSPTTGSGPAIAVEKGGLRITDTIVANYTESITKTAVGTVNSDYNLFYNAPTSVPIGGQSITGTNPLFVNPAGDDYRLQIDTPARGKGIDLGVTTDLDGVTRSNPPAIGAFEPPPAPIFTLAKTVTPTSGPPGSAITYTLVFTNTGVNAATGVIISDIIPFTQVTDLAFTVSDPSITDMSVVPPYNWQMPALAVDATATITVTGRLTDYLATGLVFTNTATITATTPETDYEILTASATFTVTCPDTYVVNTTADAGPGSLRQALGDVCTGGEVRFAPALTAGGPVTITLTSTELAATKHITITGPGADLLTVSGNNALRVLAVSPGVTAIISGVTVSNGLMDGPGSGIHNQGALTLFNTVFANNRAVSTGGGGLYNTGTVNIVGGAFHQNVTNGYGGGIYSTGNMTVRNTAFSGNTGFGYAGALYNSGVVTVTGSTFEQNQGGTGGAIYTDGSGSLTLQDTTLVNNTGLSMAGAIYARTPVTLSNCTLMSNTANMAGAIYTTQAILITDSTLAYNRATAGIAGAIQNSGRTEITNSTIAGNTAPTLGGGIYNSSQLTITHSTLSYNRGGIYNAGTLNFTNTIVANSVTLADCTNDGVIGINAHNLIEDGTCNSAFHHDPLLGDLGDYGGATWTLPLLPGSGAIDRGSAAGCLPTDQRGVARTSETCDIGAYETQGFTLTLVGGDHQRTPVDLAFSQPLTLTVAAGAWQGKPEPVAGGMVVLAGPDAGAGVTPNITTTTIAGDGSAATTLTANSTAGVYSVTASVRGGNSPITYTLTNSLPTTTTVTSDPATSVFGQVITFTMAVTAPYGVPTGSITFTVDSADTVAPLVDGMATLTRSDLAVGDHVAVAQYTGEGDFDPSTSLPYTQTVIRAASAITVTTAPNPSATTDTVTFTTTVTARPPGAGIPTGYVTFTAGATIFTATLDANGVAVAQRNDLTVGVHGVSAAYPDSPNFSDAFVNGAGQVVQATLAVAMDGTGAGTLVSEPAGIACGAACRSRFDPGTVVTVTATPLISSTFAGWIGDASGQTSPTIVTMDGDKALTATFTLKTYVITPTAGVNGSITPGTPQTVIYDAGQRFDIIPAAHHHIVDVAVDNVSVGAVSAYTFTNVTADHVITAAFAIDTHTLAVTKTGAGAGAIAQDPAGAVFNYGTVVTLTAQPVLTSTFTGWSGDATGTTNPLPVTIDGDKAITGTFIIFRLPTTTTLQSSLNPAFVTDNIVFTAQVEENIGPFGANFIPAGGPTGSIHFSDPTGAISLTGTLVNGSVQLGTASLEAGSYDVTATYSGDTYHEPSVSNLIVQVVNKHATTTSLALSPNPVLIGDQVYFTTTVAWDLGPGAANVNPQGAIAGPTGSVDFLADGMLLANAKLVNGVATLHGVAPVTGTVQITAEYLGDRASHTSASDAIALHITRRASSILLTTAPNPAIFGATILFTATVVQSTQVDLSYQPGIYSQADAWQIASAVALVPTGEVIFTANNVEFGRSTITNGVASLNYAALPAGSHILTADYSGDGAFTGSTSAPVEQVVQPLPTAVNDAAGMVQGQAKKILVLANDLDPAGGLHVTAVTQPAHGTVFIGTGGGLVFFKAPTNTSGLENFTYTATDVNGNSSTALVSVLVTSQSGGQGAPQVDLVDPNMGANLDFTAPSATVDVDLSPGFYTGTLDPGDSFFLAFTPYITPTGHTAAPPAGFKFGGLQFDLTSYASGAPLDGVTFAIPITLTIDYDPALVGDLNPATLGLWYWTGSEWSTDGIRIVQHDVEGHKITIAISHLSEFALFAAEMPSVTVYMPELNTGTMTEAAPLPKVVLPKEEVTPPVPSPFEMVEQVFLPAMGR